MKTKKKPLYEIVLDHLLEQIHSRQLSPGDQIPTEQELSQTFNVSRITAMRAVKELEHKGFVYRRKAVGTFVSPEKEWAEAAAEGGRRSGAAQSLSLISVILPFGEEIGYDILHGAEQAARMQGYYVTLHNSLRDPVREREIIEQLRQDGVQGIVLYPCTSSSSIDIVSDLMVSKFPFIVIDRNIVGIEVPAVVSNNFQGSYGITSHLIALGHRKIAFLCGEMLEMESAGERYRGYCKALIDNGIPLRKDWVINTPIDLNQSMALPYDERKVVMQTVIERWFVELASKDRPTAVVVLNDITAVSLLNKAIEHGIRVPEELSITGFDNLSFTKHLDVPLTTVEQSFFKMGEEAVNMLIGDIRSGTNEIRKVVLDTEVIIRKSTAAPIESVT
ncbi:GntR family transcriptional regulator [Paenibacillus sp. GCM10027626]|uniref:GntR family transcriptional regulator n=1 Tax=Paenibacillus sp. GCM10027626 TaxID=3273411 RepID=UPI0036279937